jgi:hypothetical protein
MVAGRGSPPAVPDLPSSALLIAPTIERAATLGTGFDEAIAVTLSELSATLGTDGPDVRCVAVTGVPTRARRLATVLAQLLVACPADLQVLLVPAAEDVTDRSALSAALTGLAFVDAVELSGETCLRFVRASDPRHVPDLTPEQVSFGPLAFDSEADLAARVAVLEAELAESKSALASTPARARGPETKRNPMVAGVVRRLRRGLVVVAVAAVLSGTLAASLLSSISFLEATASGVLGVVVVHLVYAWRCDRRTRAVLGRLSALVRADSDEARGREQDLSARLSALEKNVAIVAASSLDTAHAVAKLREWLHGEESDPAS